ncbi:hypothetical protein D3C71_1625550 [compost metagenome]
MTHHEAPAQGRRRVQGASDIGLRPVAIPTPHANRRIGAKRSLRAFGHQVDGGSGISGAMQQARRAPHDLHPLVHRHVLRRTRGVAHQNGNAILLEGVDLETARVIAGGQQGVRLHGDTRRLLHHIIERAQVLLFHALFVNDGDRLRSLLDRLWQLGDGRPPVR